MKILLIDDHVVVRAGVRHLLDAETNVSFLEAESSEDALDVCRHEQPDLIVLGLKLPGTNGLELVRRIVRLDKSLKIVVFSTHSEPIYAAHALRAGVRGYVSKGSSPVEFVEAIRQVAKGSHYVEWKIASELAVGRFSTIVSLDQLTAREIDTLHLLGEGKTYTQIAEALGVSSKRVVNSLSLIRGKLGVETAADLIRFAIESRHIVSG